MKKCMGNIIYVPGCDGSNNNTSKKQAQKRPKQPKIDLTRGGGGIIMAAVRLIRIHHFWKSDQNWALFTLCVSFV